MKFILLIMTATMLNGHATNQYTVKIPVSEKEECQSLANSAKIEHPDKHFFIAVTCEPASKEDEIKLNP